MSLFEYLSIGVSALAAVGTISATVVALWLSREGRRVKLNATIGIRHLVGGPETYSTLVFDVTNIGERDVTISLLGWRIGKRRRIRKGKSDLRPYAIPLTGPPGDRVPKTLSHGERATFTVLVEGSEMWVPEFVEQVVRDLSEKSIRTLRGQFHTSVGHTETIVPEANFLDELRALRPS